MLRIGELSERCGVSRDTVRFYERQGLLPAPSRTTSGHREYDEEAVKRLRFIRNARELSLTLEDIRVLIGSLVTSHSPSCRAVAERLRRRLDELDRQVVSLKTTRDRLNEALRLCESTGPTGCVSLRRLLERPEEKG
jgi:MerR family copper efflux transcriptional regulator